MLLWSETALIVGLLDEGGRRLDPLDVAHEHRVPGLRHLARALKLMDFEPVLLETPLGAVFDRFSLALWATVKWDKLQLNLATVPLRREASSLVQGLFDGAHLIFALAYVNNFV